MSGLNSIVKALESIRAVADRGAGQELLDAVERIDNELEQLFPAPQRLTRPSNEWECALREQARGDLLVACAAAAGRENETPNEARMRHAVMAMLLQMVFEKIAKAVLARSDFRAFQDVRTSHRAASRLIGAIRKQARRRGSPFHRFNSHKWKAVFAVVVDLENAHPALNRAGPHLEYPWEGESKVALAATDLAVVSRLADPREKLAPDLVNLARTLLNDFDRYFA
jgi:hypothetical protein